MRPSCDVAGGGNAKTTSELGTMRLATSSPVKARNEA
jgi:hypothetical protein